MYLLDVNVLIALVDTNHVHHEPVADWFWEHHVNGWATCPITENGFIRILGHINYPNSPQSADAARALLVALCAQPGHQFWPDAVSMRTLDSYPELPISKHLTDYYLLASAIAKRAKLATLDKRISPSLLAGGADALHVL
ncbi:MAG: TA system VapC family ribonuclease toxin [Lentimonas sp.]